MAKPIDNELSTAIENEIVKPLGDPRERTRILVDDFSWDNEVAKKIWVFGPDLTGPNVLTNESTGVQHLDKIRDHLLTGFNIDTKEGVMTGEPMRGIKFSIEDAKVHSENACRGNAQIVPTVRRVFYASQLTASPRFQEPMYLVEIQCPDYVKGAVYNVVS